MKLPGTWKLPDAIIRRFGKKTAGKQRAMFEDGHLLLILHQLPDAGDWDPEPVFFWRNPAGEWQFSARGNGLKMLAAHVAAFDEVEEELKQHYRSADEAEDYFRILERLAAVRPVIAGLHAALQSAREAVRDDRDIIGLRDQAGELDRSFDRIYQDTKNALDFSIARKTEEEARFAEQSMRAGHRLNILAAVFFPLAAISGIFGMNVIVPLQHMDSPWPFWVILVVGILLGMILKGWILGGADRK